MSTVVELTEQEIAELNAVAKADDVSLAIRTAMTEYVRYVRRMQLKELSGRVEMRDNWREQEAAERSRTGSDFGPTESETTATISLALRCGVAEFLSE